VFLDIHASTSRPGHRFLTNSYWRISIDATVNTSFTPWRAYRTSWPKVTHLLIPKHFIIRSGELAIGASVSFPAIDEDIAIWRFRRSRQAALFHFRSTQYSQKIIFQYLIFRFILPSELLQLRRFHRPSHLISFASMNTSAPTALITISMNSTGLNTPLGRLNWATSFS
jgi:hypothetical protein